MGILEIKEQHNDPNPLKVYIFICVKKAKTLDSKNEIYYGDCQCSQIY